MIEDDDDYIEYLKGEIAEARADVIRILEEALEDARSEVGRLRRKLDLTPFRDIVFADYGPVEISAPQLIPWNHAYHALRPQLWKGDVNALYSPQDS